MYSAFKAEPSYDNPLGDLLIPFEEYEKLAELAEVTIRKEEQEAMLNGVFRALVGHG